MVCLVGLNFRLQCRGMYNIYIDSIFPEHISVMCLFDKNVTIFSQLMNQKM